MFEEEGGGQDGWSRESWWKVEVEGSAVVGVQINQGLVCSGTPLVFYSKLRGEPLMGCK